MAHYKVYKLRHQAAGVLHDKTYAKPPSEEEVAKVKARLDVKHGTHHRKTKDPLFLRVVEETLESDEELPYEKVTAPKPPLADLVTLKDHEGKAFHVDPVELFSQLDDIKAGGDLVDADANKLAFEGAGSVTNPETETFEITSDDVATLKV